MKILINMIFLTVVSTYQLQAFSIKGSPGRCKSQNWTLIDNLLPERSLNGGYSQHMTGIDQQIANISSVQMVQSVVDHVLTFFDFCGQPVAGAGGWEDAIGTNLCERVAVYNITHNNILTHDGKSSSLSPDEMNLLKSVYRACRPSTDRYWNYPLIQHVSFQPTPEEYNQFKKLFEGDFISQKSSQ